MDGYNHESLSADSIYEFTFAQYAQYDQCDQYDQYAQYDQYVTNMLNNTTNPKLSPATLVLKPALPPAPWYKLGQSVAQMSTLRKGKMFRSKAELIAVFEGGRLQENL